jgi:isoquinoline 1-oxidoreductase alpha subunit
VILRGIVVILLHINGTEHDLEVDPDMPLLWAIRDVVGLTGTKYGCGKAQCGACTVHIDGQPVRSCVLPVAQAEGLKITTIEGLDSSVGMAVQAAWNELQVPQCGYCQSGQIMSVTSLLERNPNPDDQDIDIAMQGNICRCATYVRIRAAIKVAASNLKQPVPSNE